MKQDKEVIGFAFQVIPRNEATALAAAGMGNYSDLKAKLLEEIPNLNPDEAFAFGLPKGEITEKQRRGICMALNATLRKTGTPWKVTYSGTRRLFIVYPLSAKQAPKTKVHSNGKPTLDDLVNLSSQLWGIDKADLLNPKNRKHNIRTIRKAIQVVAVKRLGMKGIRVAEFFGLTKSAIYLNLKKPDNKGYIQELNKNIPGG